jgi:hypothetical protein
MREQGAYGIPRRKVFEFEEDNKRMEMEMLRLDGLFFFKQPSPSLCYSAI